MAEEGLADKVYQKRLALLAKRDYSEERQFIRKNASKAELQRGEKAAHEDLCAMVKQRTMAALHASIAADREERHRDLLRKEFDVITNYGSRFTK